MKKENSTYVTYGDLSFLMMLIAVVIMVVICTAAIRIDLLQDQINTLQSDIQMKNEVQNHIQNP